MADAATPVTAYYALLPESSPALLAALTPLLDDNERRRAERFRFERDRLIFAAAHALLRTCLDWTIGPWHGGFRVDAHGKPELDPPVGMPPLRFNLTHTRGLVACALAHGFDIGVDAEHIHRRTEIAAIAEEHFSAAELAQLETPDEATRAERFYRIWTLKEAIVKAIGHGLSLPLKTFAFTLDPLSLAIDGDRDEAAWWHVEGFAPTPQHAMAIALHRPPGKALAVRWREVALVIDGGRCRPTPVAAAAIR
jgi:4'-phosphopantetheinyl transferase